MKDPIEIAEKSVLPYILQHWKRFKPENREPDPFEPDLESIEDACETILGRLDWHGWCVYSAASANPEKETAECLYLTA